MNTLFPEESQGEMDFPQPLVEKYRPGRVADFIALDKPKALLTTLLKWPRPCNLVFCGPRGCGKTSMGLAFAKELNAGLIYYPAQNLRKSLMCKPFSPNSCHCCQPPGCKADVKQSENTLSKRSSV